MTRDEIMALEAGNKTNVLVAQTVMGLDVCTEHDGWPGEWCRKCQRHWAKDYSGKIAPAWKVVEKMIEDGNCPAILFDDNGHWALSMSGWQNVPDGDEPQEIATTFLVEAGFWADTVPLAICRAALLTEEEK